MQRLRIIHYCVLHESIWMHCATSQYETMRYFITSGREELGDGDTANSFLLHVQLLCALLCICYAFQCCPIHLHYNCVYEHDDTLYLVAQAFISRELAVFFALRIKSFIFDSWIFIC